jgi:hypothetical protein
MLDPEKILTSENFAYPKYQGIFCGEPVVAEYRDRGLRRTPDGFFFIGEIYVGGRYIHELRIDADTVNLRGARGRRELEQEYLAKTDMFLEGF